MAEWQTRHSIHCKETRHDLKMDLGFNSALLLLSLDDLLPLLCTLDQPGSLGLSVRAVDLSGKVCAFDVEVSVRLGLELLLFVNLDVSDTHRLGALAVGPTLVLGDLCVFVLRRRKR